jgi:redox-sensing transcriptional repressor
MLIPDRVVERLSAYRRHLAHWLADGRDRIFSHDLATLDGGTAPQVRRDLMTVGYTGSPARGYDVRGLIDHIDALFASGAAGGVALVGVGHIGGAILDYFSGRHPGCHIVAAFDRHPDKVGRVIHGHRCYDARDIATVLAERPALVGIVAVPADAAQEVADGLARAGVRGLLNFAPRRLRVPPEVYLENVDITLSLEKVAFFAAARAGLREAKQ